MDMQASFDRGEKVQLNARHGSPRVRSIPKGEWYSISRPPSPMRDSLPRVTRRRCSVSTAVHAVDAVRIAEKTRRPRAYVVKSNDCWRSGRSLTTNDRERLENLPNRYEAHGSNGSARVAGRRSRGPRGGKTACCGSISSAAGIATPGRRCCWAVWLRRLGSRCRADGASSSPAEARARSSRSRRDRVFREERSADSGRALPGLPRAGQAEGRAAARRPRGHDRRRLDRSGRRARKPQGKPAGRRHQLRRYVPDAPQVETPRRGDRHPDRMGQARRSLGGRTRPPTATPAAARPAAKSDQLSKEEFKERAQFWSFQPIRHVTPPTVNAAAVTGRATRSIVHPGDARRARALASARGRPADPDPPPELRPDRAAPDPARGRRVPGRSRARRLRTARRPPAGQPALWRTVGPPLARPGPLRRDRRP